MQPEVPAVFNFFDSVVVIAIEEDKLLGRCISMQSIHYPVVFGQIFRIPEEQFIWEIRNHKDYFDEF